MVNTATKIGITRDYLTVEFWSKSAGSQRLHQVKVPVEWLTHDEVLDALDACIRRRMLAAWPDTPDQDRALF